MSVLDPYQLYSIDGNLNYCVDEVDKFISAVAQINDYQTIEKLVEMNFGDELEEDVVFEFPNTNKEIYIVSDENAIKIYGIVNNRSYYSKGWKKH